MSETMIYLRPEFFSEKEETLVESDALSATVFRFGTGVCGLRLINEMGELVLLPFQGQQIWRAELDGRPLAMRSMFDEPRPTRDYLSTYGGFLLHCGATAMGVPVAEDGDTHPLHGELPNAPYEEAYVVVGEDERGEFIGLGGTYQHLVAFNHNYVAEPLVKLYAGSSLFDVAMEVTNLKTTDMELMYMAHINFRPVDDGRLVTSAPATPEHMRVRTSIPSHVVVRPGYREFLNEVGQHPERLSVLRAGMLLDPEVVFSIDYVADGEGWAHTMQVHPDGTADYVAHRPDQLDKGVRWIVRTDGQEDALGMVLPATAEPEGYHAEKRKGNVKTLAAGDTFRCDIRIGTLNADEAVAREAHVEAILGS